MKCISAAKVPTVRVGIHCLSSEADTEKYNPRNALNSDTNSDNN